MLSESASSVDGVRFSPITTPVNFRDGVNGTRRSTRREQNMDIGKIEFGPPKSFGEALQQNKDYEALRNAAKLVEESERRVPPQTATLGDLWLMLRCARGEHEADQSGCVEVEHTVGTIQAFICRHCRCLYAEK